MKYYYKKILYSYGSTLPILFSTNFKYKSIANKFWKENESTMVKFERFYLKDLKGDFLKQLKEKTGFKSKKFIIDYYLNKYDTINDNCFDSI